jgi:hypothetical protein
MLVRAVGRLPIQFCVLGISRPFGYFVYGVIFASYPSMEGSTFVPHWLRSWLLVWVMMLPIVLSRPPAIRSLTHMLTRED